MSPRSFAVVVTVLLLLPAGVGSALALGGTAPAPSVQPGSALADASSAPHESGLDPGEVEMRIEVAPNGDARWRLMTAVSVTNADEREAFADLVEEFNRSESPLALETIRSGASKASDATGREMAIENVRRHHALHNETGALWVTFTWTNFARTSGDRLAVDDAFNTSSGVWLSTLAENHELVIHPPDGYGVSSAPTGGPAAASDLSNGVVRWEGPRDFGDRGPWIIYSGDADTPSPTTPTADGPPPTNDGSTGTPNGPTDGPGTSPGGPGDGNLAGLLPVALLVLVGGASAAVLVAYMRRDDDDGLGGLIDGGPGDGANTAANGGSPPAEDGGTAAADSVGGSSGSNEAAAAGAAGSAAGADGASAATDDGIDEELLSDEERVERLIERNGGRMKQAAIVQETGWSNAKVSQLLSSMDDEGRIDKLRIGRENLISFPDEDVTDLDSE